MQKESIILHQKIVEDIQEYINQNIQQRKITACEVCKLSGYSRFYMHRIFRQHTGQSILQYINNARMKKIEIELLHSDKKIAEIAIDFGYLTISDLTKHFKKRYGMPPSLFRKLHTSNITFSDSVDS